MGFCKNIFRSGFLLQRCFAGSAGCFGLIVVILAQHETIDNSTCRADDLAFTTVRAFVLVDNRQGAVHGDGAILAGFEAFLATDAANGAIFPGLGTGPFVFAFDRIGV